MSAPTRLLFVCLGNICRSPLAEGVFVHLAEARGVAARFVVDSAGTGGYHAGERADSRMRACASRHGVELTSRARKLVAEDVERFDELIAMDASNLEGIRRLGGGAKASLLLERWPEAPLREVPDPYYGGDDGFEEVFSLVEGACRALLEELLR